MIQLKNMSVPRFETHHGSELAHVLSAPFPDAWDFAGQSQRQRDIGATVGSVGLAQVRDGFEMYADTTDTVHDNLHLLQFPAKIVEAIPVFSRFGEYPLMHHINGERDKIPIRWGELYYGQHSSSFLENVIKFWGAHIAEDLKWVYKLTNTEPKHRDDADLINLMLEKAAWKIMDEKLRLPRVLGRVGVNLAMYDIAPMRDRAFNDGLALIDANGDEQKIQSILSAPQKTGITEHPRAQKVLSYAVSAIAEYRARQATRAVA